MESTANKKTKNKNKNKKGNQKSQAGEVPSSPSSSASSDDQKAEKPEKADDGLSDQERAKALFEKELNWCVHQLELGLQRKGLQKEQIAESNGVITKLKNPKTPMPQKRHLMHVIFGDYRKRIQEEEKLAEQKTKSKANSSPPSSTADSPSSTSNSDLAVITKELSSESKESAPAPPPTEAIVETAS